MATIAVDPPTHQRLALLKEEWSASSYTEVIRRLLDEVRPVPASMFGSAPDLPSLTKRERDRIWSGEPTKGRR